MDYRQQYLEQGYVVVEGLIGRDDLRRMTERIDQLQETRGGGVIDVVLEPSSTATLPVLRKFETLATHDELFRRLASTPAITDIVAELTGGSEIMLYTDQAFLKPAFVGTAKPLHQDNSYFKIDPDSFGVTCWMAIDDATIANGCLRYIPGSHRLGAVKHKPIANTPHLIPDTDQPLGKQVPVPIPAGACIFHHLSVLHSSMANRSPNSRRSWTLHYANRAAVSCTKPWSEMIRVR